MTPLVVGGSVAVGRVGVVAEIDERMLRKTPGQRPQHGQSTDSGIEHADHGARISSVADEAKSRHGSAAKMRETGRVPWLQPTR